MPILPFGEWLPDLPAFANPGASIIQNVVPLTAESYGAQPTPAVYSGALSARCQGAYAVTDKYGNAAVFAADATKLYRLTAGSTNFVDVSKSGGYHTQAVPDGLWGATAFGDRVVFTNYSDPVQTFLLDADTLFSDLSADAPRAKHCATVRDFLMLGNTFDGADGAQPRRVWWSAIGNPQSWPTPGTNGAIQVQSDYQDLSQTDLGEVTGLIGGLLSAADGAVFCERGIYRITYTGSPAIFDFAVSEGAAGTQSPLSIVKSRITTEAGTRNAACYLSDNGFSAFDGATSVPIGAQKIDKTFFNDLDSGYLGYVSGAADPVNKLIYWAYHGPASAGLYNRMLVFNWDLGRWSICDISATPAEWLTRAMTIGYTLDQLDQFGTLDALVYSLDSRHWMGGVPFFSTFDSSHRLTRSTGANMAPTVETGEKQFFPGRRARISSTRPLIDGGVASVSMGTRERTIDAVTYRTGVVANAMGVCPQRITGRYTRCRMTLPAASSFTHLQGIDVDASPEGIR